jgi:putative peptidoglycan lipid II flippase
VHTIVKGKTGRSMAGNATIVAVAFAVSRLLGMVREIAIAARFGTGEVYDAYVAAFRIPDLLFVVVMSGAFGSAFIPVFGGYLAQGDADRAWHLANTLLTWTVVVLLAVALGISFLAEPLIARVIAPELSADAQALAVNLTRLLLLSPLLLGLGAAGKGMLEAQDAFTLPAVAPILYNVGIIVGALALAPVMGAYGLAAGVLIGAAGHVLIQFVDLLRRGLRYRPSLSLQTEGLGEVARLMGPRILGQAAGQSNLIVMTNFASRLGEGSISALNYANHLVLLPHGIIAMSLSTVIFPRMARQFARGERDEMRCTLMDGLRPLLFLVLPVTVLLLAFRTSIVQLLFQYGSFTAESTRLVSLAVAIFALGLLARSLIEPVTRAFYAMHDTRTPVAVSITTVFVNIGLSWWLSRQFGFAGLALSMSLTYTLRMVALISILSRRTNGIWRALVSTVMRLAGPAGAMTIAAVALMLPLARFTDPVDGRSAIDFIVFGGAVATAGGVYLALAWLLRVPELDVLMRMMERRLGGRPVLPRR